MWGENTKHDIYLLNKFLSAQYCVVSYKHYIVYCTSRTLSCMIKPLYPLNISLSPLPLGSGSIILLSASEFHCFIFHLYGMESHNSCPSETGLFHSAWCCAVWSMLLQVAGCRSFERLNNIWLYVWIYWASLVAQLVKNPPAMQDIPVWSLGWEDPLEEDMASHSSLLAWRIHRQRCLAGYSPWDRKELDAIEWLSAAQHTDILYLLCPFTFGWMFKLFPCLG